MTQTNVFLRPDPSRTVIRPFGPEDPSAFAVKDHPRAQRIADRVLALDSETLADELALTFRELDKGHRDVEALLERRFEEIRPQLTRDGITREQGLLIGAYFSEEYSFEAAALFNPSMVLHPDQSGLPDGTIRFVMSLRGIGEGHVSSVTFRTGTWGPGGVVVDKASEYAVAPRIERPEGDGDDTLIRLACGGSLDVSETVIFPMVPSQRQGIEDVRLVRFVDDDGSARYLATYTAFSGAAIREELLLTTDFSSFDMRPLTGMAAGNKGMALFPRRIDGRYVMLGRQDNENVWLMRSDDLLHWDETEKLLAPMWPWEFIQMGNCGSPIELDEGWLVITHGVGTVRTYSMGAALLDKTDPSKVLKRLQHPLMAPSPEARDGYVPNVVYSCGGIVHDSVLLLPYGVADNFASFASVPVRDLLNAMVSYPIAS